MLRLSTVKNANRKTWLLDYKWDKFIEENKNHDFKNENQVV